MADKALPTISGGRYVHIIYCDDVRHELRNKLSLIGCYGGELIVPKLPAALPKLCMRVEVMTPVERPFERLKLRVYHNEVLLSEATVDSEQLTAALASAPAGNSASPAKLFGFAFVLELSPFIISAAGSLRAEVETEGEVIRAPRLQIHAAPLIETSGATEPVQPPPRSRRRPSDPGRRKTKPPKA